jgi:pepF/M3 family oligoendopeptidase
MSPKFNLGPLPHWDLSNVYPALDDRAFKEDVRKVNQLLDDLDQYMADNQISKAGAVTGSTADLAEKTAGCLDRMNALLRLFRTLRAYVAGIVRTDSYNTEAQRIMSELEMLRARLKHQAVLIQGWIGAISREAQKLPEIIAQGGSPAEHSFFLQETAEQSLFLMSDEEEALASKLALSGSSAWQKLQGVVTSQLKVPFEKDGKTENLPITVIINLRTDPDGDIRRRAYEAELAAWEKVSEPLAACMNGVKGSVITLYKGRGREDALHQALDQARIHRDTLDTMMDAMRKYFPAFRRYWKSKAARLGVDKLPWWDLMAPMGRSDKRYSFEEARDFILDHFSRFSDRLAGFAERAFQNHWIDAEPRDGKRGGAFCMSVPAVDESRILCNFNGSLGSLQTVAHELGHAYHNECRVGKTILQGQTPMTLAETASTFCQTIITDAALSQAADAQEELSILEDFLISSSQVLVDISSRYLFEKEVFERRAHAELSAADFCAIMTKAQMDTYGEGLDENHVHPYMWTWKPHYYNAELSFYNFPYAFGLLFSLGLYAIYRERGKEFIHEYDELLSSTGEGTAADLAARFDIDIRKGSFWEGSLKLIEERIDRYVSLE